MSASLWGVRMDRYFKGRIRTYSEAVRLKVIDRRVREIVDTLNRSNVIYTVGSCQGHGFPFVRVPPYVSFKTSADIASWLKFNIEQISTAERHLLNYRWSIESSVDDDESITYVLDIPELSSGGLRYALRHRIDHDLVVLNSLAKKLLDKAVYSSCEIVGYRVNSNHKDEQND